MHVYIYTISMYYASLSNISEALFLLRLNILLLTLGENQFLWMWGAVNRTWCRGRRFSQQDPECLRRPVSSRAEQPEQRGWASSQQRSRGRTLGISFLPSSNAKPLIWTSSPSNQMSIEGQRPSILLPSPICPESSCLSRAARAPGFPLPISWGSQSSFLLFSDVQNILKMVEHSLKTHKHTPPMSTFFPESIVDSHTGCEECLHPPYKPFKSEQRWWFHVRDLTFLNISDFLWWSYVKNTEINLSFNIQRILFLNSYLKRKSKYNNSDHIKVPFPNVFKEKTFFSNMLRKINIFGKKSIC